jgi:hypothetical protein
MWFGHVLPTSVQADRTTIIAFTLIHEYILFRSLFWVLVLGRRLGDYRVHILYGCFSFDPLTLCFKQQEAWGIHSVSALLQKKCTSSGDLQSTSWLCSRKHSDFACFYSPYLGATRRLLSSTMTHSGTWWTRVLGVSHSDATRTGPRLNHDLLKDARQGGVDFKLLPDQPSWLTRKAIFYNRIRTLLL